MREILSRSAALALFQLASYNTEIMRSRSFEVSSIFLWNTLANVWPDFVLVTLRLAARTRLHLNYFRFHVGSAESRERKGLSSAVSAPEFSDVYHLGIDEVAAEVLPADKASAYPTDGCSLCMRKLVSGRLGWKRFRRFWRGTMKST